MKLYDKIKNNAELGYYSIVQDTDGEYKIISPHKNGVGSYRESSFEGTISRAASFIGKFVCTTGDWNDRENKGVTYIGVWQPEPYKRFQPGDKVLVREGAKKWLESAGMWTDSMSRTIGQVGEAISFTDNTYKICVSNGDVRASWHFPSEAIEPYYEDNEKPETINIGGTEYEITDELKEALKGLKEVA